MVQSLRGPQVNDTPSPSSCLPIRLGSYPIISRVRASSSPSDDQKRSPTSTTPLRLLCSRQFDRLEISLPSTIDLHAPPYTASTSGAKYGLAMSDRFDGLR